VQRIARRLADAGHECFLVGGSVRDALLDRPHDDVDISTSARPPEVERLVRGWSDHVWLQGQRFGTVGCEVGGVRMEITTFRAEVYRPESRKPEVTYADDVGADLSRRDFTVNAMALGLAGRSRGRLLEAPHGRADLQRRQLRVLHDESFDDDPTRLLRLARYAGRLGFAVEAHTRALAHDAVASGALRTVSGPRLGAELRLLAQQGDPLQGFRVLSELGVDVGIAPGFGIGDEDRADLARRALALLPGDGAPADLVLAVAAGGVPAAAAAELLDRLAFPAGRRDRIVAAATRAPELAERLTAAARPSEIAAAVGAGPPELVALAGGLGPESAARRWLEELRHVRLDIDGDDLLAAGVAAGPAVGAGLAAARAAKLDGRTDGRDAELAAAIEGAAGHG
jgi:tRNA nucleotidyltransferase (CCA-adding enzyme)